MRASEGFGCREAGGPAFGAAARRAVCRAVKARARAYARRPVMLETLHAGLSTAAPEAMVALALHLVEREGASPRRWLGFGGEVGLVNARAALLLGRAGRRLCVHGPAGREEPPRAPPPEPRSGAGVCRATPVTGTGTT